MCVIMSTNDWLIGTFSFYIATRNTCNGQICPITDYQSDYWWINNNNIQYYDIKVLVLVSMCNSYTCTCTISLAPEFWTPPIVPPIPRPNPVSPPPPNTDVPAVELGLVIPTVRPVCEVTCCCRVNCDCCWKEITYCICTWEL